MMKSVIQTVPLGEYDAPEDVGQGQGDSWQPEKGAKESTSRKSLSPRIALVDDDENIHLFVKDLGDLGNFRVVGSFYTGGQALDRLRDDRPDVVIMDIRLPDMSGIDCTAKLKTILPGL